MEEPQRRSDRPADDATSQGFTSTGDLLVISNRQPYRHYYEGESVAVDRPAGGLTAGLDAVMRRTDGTWIAWGDGEADADVVDDAGQVTVPPDESEGQYTLERLWLTDEQVENYYYGFSNQVLWPICHSTLTNVDCTSGFWEHYSGVNERFADAIVDSATPEDTIWFHDYHLGIAPRLVDERLPADAFLVHTWHIPWPSWDVFRGTPHARELLRGLLGNDLVGFHVPRYCENFLRCVRAALPDAQIDWENWQVRHGAGTTTVRSFPMGVPADDINQQAKAADAESYWTEFTDEHDIDDDMRVGIGVDRLDYTKGIPQRIAALERLWQSHPRWRESFTFVQVGTESRSQIPAYDEYQETVEEAIADVNERFGTDDWQPIVYTTEMIPNEGLYGLYRFADVAVVSPIRDGMNLVCQEYVAAQQDADGALVLSTQAGAHDEIGEWAVSINPHDVTAFADRIHDALTLPHAERQARMEALRRYVATHDISAWIGDVFGTVDALRSSRDRGRRHAQV